jgi:hypothetical protein
MKSPPCPIDFLHYLNLLNFYTFLIMLFALFSLVREIMATAADDLEIIKD